MPGQLEVLAADPEPEPATSSSASSALVQAEISRITRLVDDLLLLAQL